LTHDDTKIVSIILDALPTGIVRVAQDGRVQYLNSTMTQLLGSDRDWIGQPWAACLRALAPDADPNGLDDVELEGQTLSRHRIELESGLGRLEMFDDVTQVRRRDRVRDELTGLMAHELRNPLTALLGFGKLLRDKPDAAEDKRQRWANHIVDRSQSMSSLISAIVDMSRLTAGRLKFEWSVVDLGQLVTDVANEFQSLSKRAVGVVAEPVLVRADPGRLDQLLRILLDNAERYTPPQADITLRVFADRARAVTQVIDTGPGIAPMYHEQIFLPFHRGDPILSAQAPGHGLGLAIARGLVEAHAGEINLESELGAGATFTVRLPLIGRNGTPTDAHHQIND
jgi:signal transduction histidine kinase